MGFGGSWGAAELFLGSEFHFFLIWRDIELFPVQATPNCLQSGVKVLKHRQKTKVPLRRQKQIGNRQHYKFTRLCSFYKAGRETQRELGAMLLHGNPYPFQRHEVLVPVA